MKNCEINRKLLHIFSGAAIPLAILFLPHFITGIGLNIAVIVWGGMEILRSVSPSCQKIFKKLFGGFLRQEEDKKLTGTTWILLASLICFFVFKKETATLVIALSIWGDAVAGVIGQKAGRIKIGSKTLEGSIACLSFCVLLLVFVFPWIFKIEFFISFIIITSLSVTILEFLSQFTPLDDNFIIPIVTGIIITLFF